MLLTEYDEKKHLKNTYREGYESGRLEGYEILIETCQDFEKTKEETAALVAQKYAISLKEAQKYVNKYWKE